MTEASFAVRVSTDRVNRKHVLAGKQVDLELAYTYPCIEF